jgi:hypothetical protein
VIKPAWLPLYHALVQCMIAEMHEVYVPRLLSILEHSPPDARASGWLLVCHSALPVRGPSLTI